MPPVDAGEAAAEALRRALGLKPGPAPDTAIPPGPGALPPPVTPTPGPPPTPARPPQTQDPKPPPPPSELDAASRALQQLLPEARPPIVAPLPGQTTPQGSGPIVDTARAPTPIPEPVDGVPVRGSLRSRYRFRQGAGDDDHELISLLGVDIGDPNRHPVTAHFLARVFLDLDGLEADEVFAGLDESLDETANLQLFEGFLDFHSIRSLSVARLGRQNLYDAPVEVTFDGLRMETQRYGEFELWAGAYGGVPEHFYEASARGDSVYGACAGLSPWQGGRLRFDWMRIDDELITFAERDYVWGVAWWQELGKDVQLRGQHSWVNGRPRDLIVRSMLHSEPLGINAWINYRELLAAQRREVTELDPFWTIAGDYQPYRQIEAAIARDFGEHVTVTLGADARRLVDDENQGTFNREFERLHTDVALRDVFTRGLSFFVSGSWWNSSGEDTNTVTGDVTYDCSETVRASLGTGYEMYKYDFLSDRERLHVYTWYARMDWRAGPSLRFDTAYQYERDDDETFHLFRLGVTWTF